MFILLNRETLPDAKSRPILLPGQISGMPAKRLFYLAYVGCGGCGRSLVFITKRTQN